MPNKTIYISNDNLPVFEEAKNIAGKSLSSVISDALNEYVKTQRAKLSKMQLVKLPVGPKGVQRQESFVGVNLCGWTGRDDDKEWWLDADIFETEDNRIAAYVRFWKLKKQMYGEPESTSLYIADSPADYRFLSYRLADKISLYMNKMP